MKRVPNEDADLGGPYKEKEGFAQKSKLIEQERDASGNLPESSDPVNDGPKPFRITYP